MFSKVHRFDNKPEGSARAEKKAIKTILEDNGMWKKSAISTSKSSISKDKKSPFTYPPNEVHCEEIDYSTTEGALSNASITEGIQTRLLEYLDEMEIKINNQRNKVQSLRSQLFSSDENIEVSSNSSPTDLDQRIQHLKDMSRFCVKETMDFVILYNKNQEQKCAVRPQEYEDLVKFCTDLIAEVSTKLDQSEEKKKWKRARIFFKRTLRLFKF